MNTQARRRIAVWSLVSAALIAEIVIPVASHSAPPKETPAGSATDFSPYVSKDGAISRPTDYREKFLHLGTWAVAKKKGDPVHEMHNVYARAEDIQAFRRDGKFPDGATLVKEITNVSADKLTTGESSW